MKGGFSKFRGKKFYILLIAVVGTVILIWAWDETPFLTNSLPPKEQLQLSQETLPAAIDTEAKDKQIMGAGKDASGEISAVIDAAGNHSQNEGDKNSKGTVQTFYAAPVNSDNQIVTETKDKDSYIVEYKMNSSAESSDLTKTQVKQTQNARETDLKQKEQMQDFASASDTANTSSSLGKQDEKNSKMFMHTQVCNYAKGKWVVDDARPLYSGFGCKQWLANMWACRLMQRTDFAYEKLRWQPNNCQMEEFEGAKFLKRMQHKTLAFVGDSLGRQQFQSMMCMITGGEERPDVIDVGHEFGLVKPRGSVRPNGWAYRFPSTNTTVLYYWSSCLCDLEPIDIKNPATDYAMHLDRPPAFLRQYLNKIDVLVLNTGHHWNRGKLKANRWVMYVDGKPNTNRKLAMIGDAKNFTIHSIINWVNLQLPKNPHLKAFYRSISPRHFVHGDWNTGGSCDNTTPMSIGKEVLQDESSDYSAGRAVKGTGVKLLDVTALSQLRDEGHISRYSITASQGVRDCLHWCLPGVPDTWNEILFAQISDMSQPQNE